MLMVSTSLQFIQCVMYLHFYCPK